MIINIVESFLVKQSFERTAVKVVCVQKYLKMRFFNLKLFHKIHNRSIFVKFYLERLNFYWTGKTFQIHLLRKNCCSKS